VFGDCRQKLPHAPQPRGKYELTQIDDEEAKRKLVRIDNITVVKGASFSNFTMERTYSLKKNTALVTHLSFHCLIIALLTISAQSRQKSHDRGRKHSGETGMIVELRKMASSRPNMVRIEQDGKQFETIEDYVLRRAAV